MTVEKQGNMVDGISGSSMYTSLCHTNMKAMRHTAIKDAVNTALNHGHKKGSPKWQTNQSIRLASHCSQPTKKPALS